MNDCKKEFERGLDFFRNHEYANATVVWKSMKGLVLEGQDLDLYISLAIREEERLSSFVESLAGGLFTKLDDKALKIDEFSDEKIRGDFKRASKLLDDTEYAKALCILKNIQDCGGDYFGVHLLLARAAFALGKVQDALKHAIAAKAMEPEHSSAFTVIGTIFLELGRGSEAESSFRQAIEIDEKNHWAWYGLANGCFERKRYSLAQTCLRRVLELKPGWIGASSLLDEVSLVSEETQLRLDVLKMELEQHSNYPDLHHQLGLCFTSQGRFPEALECFDNALSINKKLIRTIVQRANVNMALENYEEACSDFEMAICDGLEADADLYHSATVSLEQGNYIEAAEHYSYAVNVLPDFAARYIETGRKFFHAGLYRQAIREINKGLEIASYPDGSFLLGRIAFEMKDYEKAENHLRKAIKLNPWYEKAACELARLLILKGDLREAKELCSPWVNSGRSIPEELKSLIHGDGGGNSEE